MKTHLVDTHCHLPMIKTEMDFASVEKFITVGTNLKDSAENIKLSQMHKNVFATIGIFPHEDQTNSIKELYEGLSKLYKKTPSKIVAVGECGLDFGPEQNKRSEEEQKELFKMQIGFSIEHDLPLIIHNRNADNKTLDILRKYPKDSLRGVFHCFVQDWPFAQEILSLGFYISFTPIITFKSAGENLMAVVKNIPTDKYMLETDAPLLSPTSSGIIKVAEKVAKIKGITFEEVCSQNTTNAERLFTKICTA